MTFTAKTIILVMTFIMSSKSEAQIKTGYWSTYCRNGLKKEQIYGNKNRVISTERFYEDKNCIKESFHFQTIGLVSYYKSSENFIDFLYEEIYLTLFKQELTSDFNTRKVCGLSDWELSRAQNITGLKCALFNLNRAAQIPLAGEIKYGIFQMDNSKLYYGQLSPKFNSISPEKRPVQINFLTEYTFQN